MRWSKAAVVSFCVGLVMLVGCDKVRDWVGSPTEVVEVDVYPDPYGEEIAWQSGQGIVLVYGWSWDEWALIEPSFGVAMENVWRLMEDSLGRTDRMAWSVGGLQVVRIQPSADAAYDETRDVMWCAGAGDYERMLRVREEL
jgi:hypothetical protein